jgi:CHAT domain-containing protein/Flp pilus assembly protein TadD
VRGDLVRAQAAAETASLQYSGHDSFWGWKFRLLHAQVLAARGMYSEMLKILEPEASFTPQDAELNLDRQIWTCIAHVRLHHYKEAEEGIAKASQSCLDASRFVCGELFNARGSLEVERGRFEEARLFFSKSLSIARAQNQQFLEAWSLLNLTHVALLEEHFDEAIEYADNTYRVASRIGAQRIMLTAQGNLGWASYKTGDSERALELFLDAQRRARTLGSVVDEIRWLTTAGYVYLDQGNYRVAENSYQKSLDLARGTGSKEQILDAVTSLSFVTEKVGELERASAYCEEAIALARASGNRLDELYPLFAKAEVEIQRKDLEQGHNILTEIVADPKVAPSLKWEAQHELANLYAARHQTNQAIAAYRTTIKTFENARSEIQHEGVKLPFLSNASSLYDDYVHFLLSENKTAEALSVADHARARTLAEGLGQLRKDDSVLPTMLDAPRIARRAGGPILYYFLAAKQSQLWVITRQKISLFELPPASQIDAAVRRYRKALETPRDLAESQNPDGLALYQMLVQPARPVIAQSAKVFIVPDGSLNALNFEALLAPDPKPHYWIEDVTIANASSLRLLDRAASRNRSEKRTLLLVGNPLAASPEFGTLPQAASEIANIGKRFPATDRRVLAQAEATPAAYLAGQPEQFSYIHFVAHGTASRLSPLDSAIVLSKAGSADDSFRLYARDIIQHPLHADLVTISSCYGAGTRAYSGEGLVGLSWAFLRAGAHNVIGALWDVSDASTPRLMDEMYAAIEKGKPPEEALRIAKLSLLHSSDSFRRPFYWAPFQFYTGS